jgi:hypothetical protein
MRKLLAPRRTPKLEAPSLLAFRDCLFTIFAATVHIWRPSPPSAIFMTEIRIGYKWCEWLRRFIVKKVIATQKLNMHIIKSNTIIS